MALKYVLYTLEIPGWPQSCRRYCVNGFKICTVHFTNCRLASKLSEEDCSKQEISRYLEETVDAMKSGTYPPTQIQQKPRSIGRRPDLYTWWRTKGIFGKESRRNKINSSAKAKPVFESIVKNEAALGFMYSEVKGRRIAFWNSGSQNNGHTFKPL